MGLGWCAGGRPAVSSSPGGVRRSAGSGAGSFAGCGIGGPSTGAAVFSAGWGGGDGFDFGFVFFVFFGRELAAKLKKAVEIFDGAAMEALGLGLHSQERGGDVGSAGCSD